MTAAIRLLISDIDGTLVRNDKSLSDANVAAIRRLREAGVPTSLISARPPSGMLWIAARLGLTGPIGAFNGGTVIAPDGAILSAVHLDPPIAAAAIAALRVPGVTPWLFAGGRWYAETIENAYVPRERRAANTEPVIVADVGTVDAPADKIVAVSGDHGRLAALEAELAAALGRDATVARSQPYYLDITPPSGNKGDGLRALAAAYDVSGAEIAVIGDQNNDLPMFAAAGLAIAMGQASDAVRAAAQAVARSNEEDGVADAIDRILIPRLQPVSGPAK